MKKEGSQPKGGTVVPDAERAFRVEGTLELPLDLAPENGNARSHEDLRASPFVW